MMDGWSKRGGTAILAGSALLIAATLGGPAQAQADEPVNRPVQHRRVVHSTPVRTAERMNTL